MQGLAPDPSLAARVAAVPYDVVDVDEARALAADEPLSLLHVDRAEIDLPDGTDPHSFAVYSAARRAFDRLVAERVLVREPGPCVYVYRLTMGEKSQRGLVGLFDVADYDSGAIKRHELTRREKEDDRVRLISTLRAQTGPVFLACRDDASLTRALDDAERAAPRYDVLAPDGVRHRVVRVDEPSALVAAARALPAAYIADGHHRAASAARVARDLAGTAPSRDDDAALRSFLAVLFPASELTLLPYHRVVVDLAGLTPDALLDAARRVFEVTPADSLVPEGPRHARMYLAGRAWDLGWDVADGEDAVSRLDVSVLQDRLLGPVLGVDDPRSSPRIDFVGGIRGPGELVRRVDEGRAAVAFAMHPTTVDEVMNVADAGRIMPPKSTWFEPKLRSGFFVHAF